MRDRWVLLQGPAREATHRDRVGSVWLEEPHGWSSREGETAWVEQLHGELQILKKDEERFEKR